MSHRVPDPSEPVASSTMYDRNSAVQYKSITNHKRNEHKSKLNINHPNNSNNTHQFMVMSSNLANITGRTREVMEGATNQDL